MNHTSCHRWETTQGDRLQSPHPEESVVLLSGQVENDDGPPVGESESCPSGAIHTYENRAGREWSWSLRGTRPGSPRSTANRRARPPSLHRDHVVEDLPGPPPAIGDPSGGAARRWSQQLSVRQWLPAEKREISGRRYTKQPGVRDVQGPRFSAAAPRHEQRVAVSAPRPHCRSSCLRPVRSERRRRFPSGT